MDLQQFQPMPVSISVHYRLSSILDHGQYQAVRYSEDPCLVLITGQVSACMHFNMWKMDLYLVLQVCLHHVAFPAIAVFYPIISLTVRVQHHGSSNSTVVQIEMCDVA